MPPIMTSEQRARSVQASPAQKPYPRGFVAAVPTSPAPLSPLSPPALQPPPPSHYFRNRNRSSEDSALFRKRSEIYTRVQRVLPPAPCADDSASGLLFGSDFHADWSNSQFGRPPLSSPRFVVAIPIHAAHTPAAPQSAQPPSVSVQSNSNLYDMPPSRDEDDALEVSSSLPAHASNKERPSRRPLRALLRERLTVKVRSRSVEAASAAQPTSSTDDLPRYSTELGLSFNQQCALVWPPSPGSSASSAAYEPSFWGSEVDSDKKSVSSSASQSLKGAPPTPPSPTHINLRTPPPSAPISLLEAQKVRRAKAFDQFTRYSETTPFQFQRGMPTNNLHAAPVPVPTPVLALHSAHEIPTEAPVQMQWATEMHRVSSAPNLKHQFHRQPHSQSHPQSQSQSQSQAHSQQLVAPQFTASPPPALTSPLLPLPSHAPAPMNATTTSSTTAPEGKHHRPSGHRKSTGVIPGVGSLKAILRPRAHSKAAATGAH